MLAYESKMTTEKLTKWIHDKLNENGWSIRELARRSNISHVTITNVLNGDRNPGAKFCLAIASGLRVPADQVLRLADLLPSATIGQPTASSEERELLDYYRALSSDNRRTIITLARALHEQRAEYAKKPVKGEETHEDP